MMDGEKRERRQLDEIDRLKAKLKDYTAKLSVQGTADLVQLKEENTKLQTKIDNLQKSNEELEKKLKLLQVEKDRNLKVGKSNHQKTVDTVEALQSEIQKLNQKLNVSGLWMSHQIGKR
jgi:seryl-tRNA synthetase